MSTRTDAVTPRPHQVQALTDLVSAFAVHDRVQLRMACGTGKTLVGRWHAEAIGAQRVLVLVPSLALLAQTLGEWRRARTGWSFEALVVCSDPTTTAGAAERSGSSESDYLEPDWATVRAAVTTDPGRAARFMDRAAPDRPQVIFSTYHSAPVVAGAQAKVDTVFDLAICDEAHRLAGSPRDEFRVVLDARRIRSRRRLFMTATPRVGDGDGGGDALTMDDPRVFGVVAHTVTFGEAIEAGLLTDYQVLVVGTDSKATARDARDASMPAKVLFDAIDRFGVKRILSYHSRIAKARGFAELIHGAQTPNGTPIAARHVSGRTPAVQRAAVLRWLAETTTPSARVVANARVLTEGVDVPAVDGVCFIDERNSVVDIVQAIGRVLRPAPGKTIGTIIVPVVIPDEADDDTELMLSSFGTLWTVLRGLRAHDQRFARDLDIATRSHFRNGTRGYRPRQIQFILPSDGMEDRVHLRMVQEVGDRWQQYYAAVEDHSVRTAGRRLTRNTRWKDLPIGEWAVKQRTARSRGLLSADHVEALERLDGWYWDHADAAWDDTYTILQAHVDVHGTIADAGSGESVFAGKYSARPHRERLGTWIARQRHAHRDGVLDPRRTDLLEQLPGWRWQPLPDSDAQMIEALRQFVEFEKHADVPADQVEDGLPLGRWVRQVRRRKLTGTLAPTLEDEIWAATPSRWLKGPRTRWQWDKPETQWALAYTALAQFAKREGHAMPTGGHREALPDTDVAIGQWAALQRHEYKHTRLDQARVRALEALPGWRWDATGNTRPFEEPLDLPSHLIHGRAGAIARGCWCEPCATARRRTQNEHKARVTHARLAGSVPAAAARRHLLALEQAVADTLREHNNDFGPGRGRRVIATGSGVPLGVLRRIADGSLTSIKASHAARILATTAAVCRSHLAANGSRGRLASPSLERIDAGPTRQMLDELRQRGFSRLWVGRELGYSGALQMTGATVTRDLAERITSLAAQVGDLRMPVLGRNQQKPTLAELKADARKVA